MEFSFGPVAWYREDSECWICDGQAWFSSDMMMAGEVAVGSPLVWYGKEDYGGVNCWSWLESTGEVSEVMWRFSSELAGP